MNIPYRLQVTLWIRAPLITSGGGNSLRGVDRMFNRNSTGQLVLQGSHIKGKLREALEDLQNANAIANLPLEAWFGRWSGEGSYDPHRGSLIFEDYYPEQAESQTIDKTATRVSIDPQTGTGREHQLFVTEKPFPSGALTVWKGAIRFWAADTAAAGRIKEALTSGLKWMNTLGGIKGSGFGRLEKVATEVKPCTYPLPQKKVSPGARQFHLYLELEEGLFIGGVVNSTNYLESRRYIPGAVLKGSFAKFLNDMCGEKFTVAIDAANQKVANAFPNLAENFHVIRFSHAFPAPPGASKRPVTIPFSAVQVSDSFYDAALYKEAGDADLRRHKKAPEFAIDWKNPEALNFNFGWASCTTINKTRTQIHKTTRTAEENKLYTFRYISPYEEGGKIREGAAGTSSKIRWIANITMPEKCKDPAALTEEFYRAIHSGWERLGKRNSRFRFDLNENYAPAAVPTHHAGVLADGKAIVTLQTDALLFDAYAQTDLNNLAALYRQYWNEASNGACQLSHFFARQVFYGGYFGSMYRTHAGGHYFPYVLTAAGSVFVLEAASGQEKQAHDALKQWQAGGLPLPGSILNKIRQASVPAESSWRACPFVPENGFGEICVNLEWHWKNSF